MRIGILLGTMLLLLAGCSGKVSEKEDPADEPFAGRFQSLPGLELVEQVDDFGYTERMQRRIADGARQGSYQRVNPQGVIVEEAFFSNDTLHRQRVLYYPNGDTLTVEHYQNGSFEGPFRQYYENGTLQLQGQFAESKAAGEWRQYYDSGELMEIVTFQDNLENGPFVEYYRNGNLKAEGAYLNGDNEQGPLNLYDENGTLIRKMNCEEGICRTIWSSESE